MPPQLWTSKHLSQALQINGLEMAVLGYKNFSCQPMLPHIPANRNGTASLVLGFRNALHEHVRASYMLNEVTAPVNSCCYMPACQALCEALGVL